MKRVLFVMIDGLGDLAAPTTSKNILNSDIFSIVNTPTLSKYFLSCQNGFYGLMDPVEPGIACGSDTAHLAIFGFDPLRAYTGRGAFETIGAGLPMSPGEIGFKCNFAHADLETGKVIHRRVDKDFSAEARELCEYLQKELNQKGNWLDVEGISVNIKYATEHRCGIKIGKAGMSLSDEISGTDPLYDDLPLIKCRACNLNDDNANNSAAIVQRLSDEISYLLINHPLNINRIKEGKIAANTILFRGCSRAPELEDFNVQNHLQWNPAMMARTCIISGIGNGIGFEIIPSSGYYLDQENIYSLRKDIDIFLDYLNANPSCAFGFFHIKSVDEASHDHDFIYKIKLIEDIDNIIKYVIERLIIEFMSDEFHIVITGDHTTLCRIGEHSCEPVPFLVSGPISQKTVTSHSQSQICSRKLSECFIDNNLGRFTGKCTIEFLKHLLNK